MASLPWQNQLAQSLRSADDLVSHGLIPREDASALAPVLSRFQFRLTPYYASLINRNDPDCPIRQQAIPQVRELQNSGVDDPLEDLAHQPAPRVTHRYPNRALLHLTSNCSMYCRYCFRKTLLNEKREDLFSGDVREAFNYLASHPEINEVILSGGDPLLLADREITRVLGELDEMKHIRRIRIHTRVPVTLPQRITPELVQALDGGKPRIVVSHFNHPSEVTPEAREAVRHLSPFTRLNQSVLLRGVNADPDILADLSEALFAAGVLPYYLHHPDPAAGTAHFDLSRQAGWEIYGALRRRLPGYLVPRYVVETGGTHYKPLVVETLEKSGRND